MGLEAGSPRSSHQQIQDPLGAHFLVHGWHLLAVSSHGRRTWELSGVSSIRALPPFMRASPSWHNHLSTATSPVPSPWGLGFSIWFGGGRDINIQTIAIHEAKEIGSSACVTERAEDKGWSDGKEQLLRRKQKRKCLEQKEENPGETKAGVQFCSHW